MRLFNLFPLPKTPIRDVLTSYTKINNKQTMCTNIQLVPHKEHRLFKVHKPKG
jgi:hypothetical protein